MLDDRDKNKDVLGPEKLDTLEQYRTREKSTFVERKDDNDIRTDPQRSSLQRNMDARGGVDDRGAENGAPVLPEQFEGSDWER